MTRYEDAVVELYQAPLAQFVAERKRLAAELKATGDKEGAKALLARGRPTISAWVVNQLYWHARDAFDGLLKTAERLRKGDLAASAEHRDAIAKLRTRAAALLEDAGHNASEATLRRVTTTLAAIAATGNFDPDPPGALAADRDPPGFEAVGIPSEPLERPEPPAKPKHAKAAKDELAQARAAATHEQDEAEAERRAAEIAENKRIEAERKQLAAERHRIEAALRTARAELHDREREVTALEKQLRGATDKVERARMVVSELESKLDELEGN